MEDKGSTIETNVPGNALWLVWVLWVLTYILGYGMGGYIGATAAGQVLRFFPEGERGLNNTWAVLASGVVWALVLGFILSGFQALLLHYHIRGFDWRRWVFSSTLGLVGATALVAGLHGYVAEQAPTFLYYALYVTLLVGIGGGVWGWAQHLALGEYLHGESVWIIATSLAAAIGTLVAILLFASRRESIIYLDIDFFLLGGGVFITVGVATGLVLYWLLRKAQRSVG